ncbi:YhdP family protein [Mangrovitalea sediminis]|uniref:YhdP family protein n=1 Tax=Mangrovitalea sediminis TaxID=1982043 RepID=UPI000BE4C123|nr:YhdP family protein [Mangrovitalea sediminis]
MREQNYPPQIQAGPRTWQRWLRRLTGLIWSLVLLVLTLIALYVGIGRQWVETIGQYRVPLEHLLSERLGQPVTIGSIQGRWQSLDPIVEIHDFTIHSAQAPQQPAASLKTVRLRLDTLASLLRLRLVFRDLSASGAHLSVVQSPDGRVGVKGIWLPSAEGSTKEVAFSAQAVEEFVGRWVDKAGSVLSNPHINVRDIRVTLQSAKGVEQTLQVPQLRLVYVGGTFEASGQLTQGDDRTPLAAFVLRGEHFFRGHFNGEAYFDIRSGHLFDQWLQRYQWQGVQVLGLNTVSQAWLDFKDGRIQQVLAKVAVSHLELGVPHQTVAPVDNLSTLIGWRRQGDTWSMAVSNLTWQWGGQRVAALNATLSRDSGWHVRADQVDIGPWSSLLHDLALLPADWNADLGSRAPKGQLSRLSVDVNASGNFQVAANLAHVSVKAAHGAPGVTNLSGYLAFDDHDGEVIMNADNASLGFPDLFKDSWLLSHLGGQVTWHVDNHEWTVKGDDLTLDYGQKTRFNGAFELLLSPRRENTLSLHVGLRNGDASLLPLFVPVHAVSPALYHWLTTAITQADIPAGDFYGHGSIQEGAPPGSFTTSMSYQFSNASVTYQPDWPSVQKASGSVTVQGGDAHIQIDQGVTGGITLEPGTVDVTDDTDGTWLQVHASAPVPAEVVPQWLTATPLHRQVGDWIKDMTLTGQFHLKLGLDMLLGSSREPRVQLDVGAKDATLVYKPQDLAWSKIQGQVMYDSDKGFATTPLQARFLGAPVKVSLSGGNASQGIVIGQTGTADMAKISALFGLSGGVPGVTGTAGYQARLEASRTGSPRLVVDTDGRGLSVDWPAPLNKPSGEARPLHLVLSEGADQALRLTGHWGDTLAYQLDWQGAGLSGGRVVLGKGRLTSSETAPVQGLHISGTVKALDVAAWQGRLKALLAPSPTAASSSASQPVKGVDLLVGRLQVAGQSFPNTRLLLSPDKGAWTITLSGSAIDGSILVPANDTAPTIMKLARLDVTSGGESGKASVIVEQQGARSGWPLLDATIQQLSVNGKHYGAWHFSLRPSSDALLVQNIEGSTGSLKFSGNLIWEYDRGGMDETRLDGTLKGGNLNDLSAWLDKKVPLKNKSTDVEFHINWQGSPTQFSLARLNGDMKFLLKDGVILQDNDVAQIFRIFGILNTDTIWRRLKFDFSDLYKAGVAFDGMSGKANFEQGTLILDPDMQVVGPSLAFRLSGSTHLLNETLDMRLVVILPLTQNLPLAALLVGVAPPVGGALFVLDKILGEPLSKLTSATYNVTGTWDHPDMKLRNIFDTGSNKTPANTENGRDNSHR